MSPDYIRFYSFSQLSHPCFGWGGTEVVRLLLITFSRFGHGAELADINSSPPLPPFLPSSAAASFIIFLFLFMCQIRQCCIYKLSV